MNEPMNMATKIIMVQEVGTEEEIKSCINEKGQWHEPYCDRVLLKHGFLPVDLNGYNNGEEDVQNDSYQIGWIH